MLSFMNGKKGGIEGRKDRNLLWIYRRWLSETELTENRYDTVQMTVILIFPGNK